MARKIIVGQSGGPTAVINASLAGIISVAKQHEDLEIWGMRNGIEGFLAERFVNLRDYIRTEKDLKLLMRTPSAFLGSCRFKLPTLEKDEKVYARIFEILEKNGIDVFMYIGGNDSMDTIAELSTYAERIGSDIRFMGVPKTIDNDLVITDHTPGFGSAAKYIATSVKELIRDNTVNDMNIVSVIEIMGRDAGWLVGSSSLAEGADCAGPDLIYLPELTFDVDRFIERVSQIQKERRSVIVCVSEGIRTEDGQYVCEYTNTASRATDAFGHKQLTGTARVLADVIAIRLGCKVRAIEFSSLQRCAAHLQSRTDMEEAFKAGAFALRSALEGVTGKLVIFERVSNHPYDIDLKLCDVRLVANLKKDVPRDWINEEGDYVTKEFRDYVRPLIVGEVRPIMENGLPRHIGYIK
ncbi:MAG: 6-phosphofructokinase [Oscillospiraceae bacterium]|nr:6-phosphofructokinase [Oscillospiraceae bacterium]